MLVPDECSTGPTKNLRPVLGISRHPQASRHPEQKFTKTFKKSVQEIFIFQTSRPLAQGSPSPSPTPLAKIIFKQILHPPNKNSSKNSRVLLRKDEPPIAVGNPDQQNAIRSKNIGSPRSLPVGLHRRCNHHGEPRGPMLPCHKGRTL